MRLLNTLTLDLHEFFGSQIPPYAILTHRWEDAEVTFQDLQSGTQHEMKGWSKVTRCCAKAAADGWKYVVSVNHEVHFPKLPDAISVPLYILKA